MRVLPYGEKAILLEFTQEISPVINQKVQLWEARIKQADLPDLAYTIPAYASLVIVFRQVIQDMQACLRQIQALETETQAQSGPQPVRYLKIPVCYEADYALDKDDLLAAKQETWTDLVDLHASTIYQVYMLGFSPGFAFMGTLPTALQVKRKNVPRLQVPSGSVGIAGQQTGIYPDEIPGGWQIIGRTPIPPFSPLRENPFLFRVGDQVQFFAIDRAQFLSLKSQIETQTFKWSQVYV
jgi:KipI family sensor histidine kinase inhibitor